MLGIAGGFASGITSDRVYGGRRAPVITYGFIGMAVTLCLLGLSGAVGLGPWVPAGCLAALSFFVNGAHGMVGGAASMDFGGRKAAATAAGLFDGMQYLASSLRGPGDGLGARPLGLGGVALGAHPLRMRGGPAHLAPVARDARSQAPLILLASPRHLPVGYDRLGSAHRS